jgi:glycosyltransferase involved in cell wall biosynthesis
VSVVIPSYNVDPYISDAVLSAVSQTYRNLEIIIVNDGSTDGTGEVIDRLIDQTSDKRIRVVKQNNQGLSAARNTGIANASGELIAFLDGDDAWSPHKIEHHVRVLASAESIGLTASYSSYMTEKGRRTGAILAGKVHPTLHDMLRRNHFGNGSTIVARRQCFEQAGNFNTRLKSCEDYEMWCRILWATEYRAVCIPYPLTFYRLRDSGLSFSAERFTESAELAVSILREYMPFVPGRVFRRARAEHYQIAAWKAVVSGRDQFARSILKRALALCPWLALTDPRPAVVMAAAAVPRRHRFELALTLKCWSGALRKRAPEDQFVWRFP